MTDTFEHKPFQLNDLDDDLQKQVVKMPYRIGMFVSQSDTVGGDKADEKELQALEVIVTSYAEDYCKSEFIEQVMRQTVLSKSAWDEWAKNINSVPEECQALLHQLEETMAEKDLNAFKSILYEIGRAVALAYRELDSSVSGMVMMRRRFRFFKQKMVARKTGQEQLRWEQYLNISGAEQRALDKLQDALGF